MITLFYSFVLLFHPIHASVTEINYSEKDKALQITSRIFIDDLELAVRAKRNDVDLDITQPKNGLTTKQLVKEYLADHLKIKVDGKPVKLNFLAVDSEEAAFLCYLEIENVKKIKTLEVFNDVITETHNDQSNLVHVTYKGPIKSARLVGNHPTEVFKFEGK
jgi:hypothetical protein